MIPRLSIFVLMAALVGALSATSLHAQGTFNLTALVVPGDSAPVPAALVRARFPSVGTGGQVAFAADAGLLLQTSVQQIVIAGYGDPAPGGGTFITAARGAPPSMNALGQIVFTGEATSPSRDGIFMYSGGATTQVVGLGDPAPGGGNFGFLNSPVVNDSGQVAFIGRARGLASIIISSQGGLTRLVGSGDPAPGGGTFVSFGSLSMNGSGHVVFTAFVSGGSPGIFLASGPSSIARIVTTSDPSAKGSLNDADNVAYVLNQGQVGAYLFSQGSPTTLAQAGDPAPGGGSFTAFDSPALNASGQVAFTAHLSAESSGVFLFSGGAVQSVVHPGDTSPEGDTFSFVETATLNADGQVAFTGRLNGGFGGVYLATAGGISRIAGMGDSLGRTPTFWGAFIPSLDNTGRVVFTGESFPGLAGFLDQGLNTVLGAADPTPDGGVLTSWTIPPAMNDLGQLVIYGQSSMRSTYNLFLASNRTLTTVVSYGDPAPGGGTFTDFAVWLLSMNNSGVIAFDGTVSAQGRSGLFTVSGTTLSSLAQVGDAAPGGGTFQSFGSGSINAIGQVAFQATVASPGRSGIFMWSAGTTTAIAQTGDAAPGGGTFAFDALSYDFAPSINAAGQVAFGAGLPSGQEGVYLFVNGATTRVAGPGDPAPGGGTFNDAFTPWLNDGGQVAFAGDTSSVSGVFLLSGGSLAKVAATGDAAPRGGAFSWAADPVLNNLGQIAFDGVLAGGGRGAFLALPQ